MHDVCSIEYRYREKVRLNYLPYLISYYCPEIAVELLSSCIVFGEKAVFRLYKSVLGGKDILK